MSQESSIHNDISQSYQYIIQLERNDIEFRDLSIKEIKEEKAQIQNETKNIPKNLGVMLKNNLIKTHQKLSQYNLAIKKFIQKGNSKKNYTRKDFKKLFQNEEARKICQEYFCSFQIINDILKSKKIKHMEIELKYIQKLFLATFDPDILSILKYQEK